MLEDKFNINLMYICSYDSFYFRRGPSQDVPFDLILLYMAKTIPTLFENDQFVI